jgi:hypothetical protein
MDLTKHFKIRIARKSTEKHGNLRTRFSFQNQEIWVPLKIFPKWHICDFPCPTRPAGPTRLGYFGEMPQRADFPESAFEMIS